MSIAFSEYIVYADESGDHGLEKCDPNFPVFVLTLCVFKKSDYSAVVAPGLQNLKFKHFGHDMAVFHERDIYKAQGPFAFLTDAGRRDVFFDDLNKWVESSPFVMVAVVIKKLDFIKRHADKRNPYHFAMQLGLERVDKFLRRRGQNGLTTHIVFEARGKREDDELELEFRRVCDGANYRNEKLTLQIVFAKKQCNSTGLQLADLTARPIGRHVLSPTQPNRAYEIIEKKLDRSASGETAGYGLKCYP